MTETLPTILLIIFLAIFVATAVIALCSLPGWIKIPDSYRKILFSSLLLEVVACVILLFRLLMFGNEKPKGDWIALNPKGQIVDTLGGMDKNRFLEQARESATFHLYKEARPNDPQLNDFIIRNRDSVCMGRVSETSLINLNIFDDIKVDDNDLREVMFTKQGDLWLPDNKNNLLGLEIVVSNNGYSIADKAGGYSKEVSGFDKTLTAFRGADDTYYFVNLKSVNLKATYQSFSTEKTEIKRSIDTSLLKRNLSISSSRDAGKETVTFTIIRIKQKRK